MLLGAAHSAGKYTVPDAGTKKCVICKRALAPEMFCRNRARSDGLNTKCRECGKKLWRKYRNENRAKLAKAQRVARAAHPDKYRKTKKASNRKPIARFKSAIAVAARRGIEWSLSLEFFERHIDNGRCLYCHGSIPEVGHGLDRIDNSIGYIEANVVPCCTRCNLMRGDHLTHDEMLQLAPLLQGIRAKRLADGGSW